MTFLGPEDDVPDQRTFVATSPARTGTLDRPDPLGRWRAQTVAIKYGGSAMERPDLRAAFARDVVRLHAAGVHPVVIHGGGPQIDALMRRLGKTPRFVDGLRVTDDETIELVEMVLIGRVNPEIVGSINRHGGHAMGLNGKDDDLIVAHRHAGELGWVGDVDFVNPAPLRLLETHGVIPVVAPIATGRDGETYNVNADHVAGAVAAALGAAVLLQLTDVPGILDRDGHHIPTISRRGVGRLIREGVIRGGMVPKVGAALTALQGGATRVRILDGRQPGAVTLGLLGTGAPGTEIVR